MDLNFFVDANENIELRYADFHQVEPHKVVSIDLVYYAFHFNIHIDMMAAIANTPMVKVSVGNPEHINTIKYLFETLFWQQVREICLLLFPTATYEEMKAFSQGNSDNYARKLLIELESEKETIIF